MQLFTVKMAKCPTCRAAGAFQEMRTVMRVTDYGTRVWSVCPRGRCSACGCAVWWCGWALLIDDELPDLCIEDDAA